MKLGYSVDLLGKSWKLQRSYLFELLLPDLKGISGLDIGVYCQDVKFGDYGMTDMVAVMYGSKRKGYAGFFQIPPMTATFIKPIPDLVSEYFYQWKGLITDDSGAYYPKTNYALNAYVKLYDRDGSESGTYKLLGVFPKTLPSHNLSYVEESVVKFEIEFNVDDIQRTGAVASTAGSTAVANKALGTIGSGLKNQATNLADQKVRERLSGLID